MFACSVFQRTCLTLALLPLLQRRSAVTMRLLPLLAALSCLLHLQLCQARPQRSAPGPHLHPNVQLSGEWRSGLALDPRPAPGPRPGLP